MLTTVKIIKCLFSMNNLKSTLKLQKILPICARSFVNPHPGTENVSAEAKGIKQVKLEEQKTSEVSLLI